MSRLKTILVIDDGGFSYERADSTGFPISLDNYSIILGLAKKHNIHIPIAVTAAFLDIKNISELGIANSSADKIIDFFKNNKKYVSVWNHGLNHMYNGEFTEFGSYSGSNRSPKEQSHILDISQKIFSSVGLAKPEVLVPPGHFWQQNVTDKISSKYGIKSIAIRESEKSRILDVLLFKSGFFKKTWNKSKYLGTIYRLGLGIKYNKTNFSRWDILKMKKYVSRLSWAMNLIVHRKLNPIVPGHFFAHLQNFSRPESGIIFSEVIRQIKKSSFLDE